MNAFINILHNMYTYIVTSTDCILCRAYRVVYFLIPGLPSGDSWLLDHVYPILSKSSIESLHESELHSLPIKWTLP